MRKALAVAVVTAIVMPLVNPWAGSAATQYTITAGTTPGAQPLGELFYLSRCNGAVLNSELNGKWARIIDVSGLAGRRVPFWWQADQNPRQGTISRNLFWTAGCSPQYGNNMDTSAMGASEIDIPAGSQWMLVGAGPSIVSMRFTVGW